jgi:FAS-associated factor 2
LIFQLSPPQDIHNFIFCHPDAPDAFELTQNFPKRVLNCGKFQFDQFTGYESAQEVIEATKERVQVQTVGDAGLQNREAIFVSDLDA